MKKGRDFWGRRFWTVLHYLARHYSTQKSSVFKIFMQELAYLLPCIQCRQHLKQNLRNMPIDSYLVSPQKLSEWMYNLHDTVNGFSKPPKKSPPFVNVWNYYSNMQQSTFYESLWVMLHSIGATYDPTLATHLKTFLYALQELLPQTQNKVCFRTIVKDIPVTQYLSNNHDVFFWTYVIRDKWNVCVDNDEKLPAYDQFKIYYFTALGDDCRACQI